jgi:hypothetical protein
MRRNFISRDQYIDPGYVGRNVDDQSDEYVVENVLNYLNEVDLHGRGPMDLNVIRAMMTDYEFEAWGDTFSAIFNQIKYLVSKPFSQLYVRQHIRSLLTQEFYHRCVIALDYFHEVFSTVTTARHREQARTNLRSRM